MTAFISFPEHETPKNNGSEDRAAVTIEALESVIPAHAQIQDHGGRRRQSRSWSGLLGPLVGLPLLLAIGAPGALGKVAPAPTRGPGAALFLRKGCVACHTLTGDPDAVGTLGPDLSQLYQRMDARKVRAILTAPQQVKPGTIMPQLDLTARQVAILQHFLLTPIPTPTPAPTPTPRPRPTPTSGF